MHGQFKHDVKVGEKDELIVNGNKIKCLGEADASILGYPWFVLCLFTGSPCEAVGKVRTRCIQASREGPKALPWKDLGDIGQCRRWRNESFPSSKAKLCSKPEPT